MIAKNEIKGLIRARGMTQADVAKMMGIHETTLNRKLNKGILNSNEIEAMINILNIKNPASIFFWSLSRFKSDFCQSARKEMKK